MQVAAVKRGNNTGILRESKSGAVIRLAMHTRFPIRDLLWLTANETGTLSS